MAAVVTARASPTVPVSRLQRWGWPSPGNPGLWLEWWWLCFWCWGSLGLTAETLWVSAWRLLFRALQSGNSPPTSLWFRVGCGALWPNHRENLEGLLSWSRFFLFRKKNVARFLFFPPLHLEGRLVSLREKTLGSQSSGRKRESPFLHQRPGKMRSVKTAQRVSGKDLLS